MGGKVHYVDPRPRKLAKPSPRRGEVKRVPCKGSALRLWGSAKVWTYGPCRFCPEGAPKGPSSLIWKCDKGKTPLEASKHSRPPSWIVSSARWGRGRRHKEASRFAGKGLKGGGAADARSLPRRFRLRVWEAHPPLRTVPYKGFASHGSRCQKHKGVCRLWAKGKHKGATLAADVVRTSAVSEA